MTRAAKTRKTQRRKSKSNGHFSSTKLNNSNLTDRRTHGVNGIGPVEAPQSMGEGGLCEDYDDIGNRILYIKQAIIAEADTRVPTVAGVRKKLDAFTVFCIIANRIIGTGMFSTSAGVLVLEASRAAICFSFCFVRI